MKIEKEVGSSYIGVIQYHQYKNQRLCASFSIIVTILFLSFCRATTAPSKLIDRQLYKRLRGKILIAFHSLSNFNRTTTQLNLSFLKNLNHFKTMVVQQMAVQDHFLEMDSHIPSTIYLSYAGGQWMISPGEGYSVW